MLCARPHGEVLCMHVEKRCSIQLCINTVSFDGSQETEISCDHNNSNSHILSTHTFTFSYSDTCCHSDGYTLS